MGKSGDTRKMRGKIKESLKPTLPTTRPAASGQTKKTFSTLVAVPIIPILKQKPLQTPPSSSPSKAETPKGPCPPTPQPDTQDVKTEIKDDGAAKEEKARLEWEYDVYAEPFIPGDLRAVNQERGVIVETVSKHKIDSSAYVQSFLGNGFIPVRPRFVPTQDRGPLLAPGTALTAATYFQYFEALIRTECVAQEIANEKYALYKVLLLPALTPDTQDQLYAFSIPGLREDSPRVEMGDLLQMRQLHVDRTNNLVALPVQLADPSLGPPVLQVWGGTQYNACVHSVNRAVERVFVRITGYTPLYSITRDFIPQSAVFNVVFPLKLNILKSQRQGLDFVASELKSIHQGSQRAAHQELSRKVVDIITKATWSTTHANGTHAEFTSQGQPSNDWIRRMLFPDAVDGVMQTKLRTIPTRRGLFDHNMNYEQLQSVHSVCENEYGILPFLISGPPGTGKTKTLVELALNLLNSTNVGHVLICAPSDSAADTLALRLKRHLTPKQLLRLNGPNRADNEVPQDLLPYCYIEHDMFYIPPFPQLMAYNVVVTSTRDAAILTEVRLTNIDLWLAETGIRSAFHPETSHTAPTLHWGALLMDEAAQATEVESLPAISVVMPPSTYSASMPQPRFVMAGDQNQLGPRTASLDTKYATSLFERLFSRDLYDKHPLSRSSVRPSAAPPVMTAKMLPMLHPPFTNLIRNYRSHPAILSVPSQLFYHDTLIPEATILSTPLQTSPLWHGRKWPILFIAHAGPDDIERDGGGWYNHSEARVACHIAARLVTESSVAQKDVVIMSPFAAQVKVLRRFMRSGDYNNGAGMWDINIGPLEAFQGLESRVVIICTTRTRPRFLDMDAKRGLGIVGQKRKMNVALTRAKEALFVIGNPEVLGQDEHWRTFLGFCWRNRLVDKRGVLWNGEKESSEGKVGVLERALLVKEERQSQGKDQKTGRALGAGNVPKGLGDEEELWMEELKAVLEEYGDIDDDDDYEDDHAEEEDENEYTQDDPANASASMELADRESNSGDEVMQYVGRFRNGRPSF